MTIRQNDDLIQQTENSQRKGYLRLWIGCPSLECGWLCALKREWSFCNLECLSQVTERKGERGMKNYLGAGRPGTLRWLATRTAGKTTLIAALLQAAKMPPRRDAWMTDRRVTAYDEEDGGRGGTTMANAAAYVRVGRG